MKIAIVLPDLRGGGAERVCMTLANRFKTLGHDVTFLLMRAEGDLLPEAETQHTVVNLGVPSIRKLLKPLCRWLKSHPQDFILGNIWPVTVIVACAAALAGCRLRTAIIDHNPLSLQYGGKGWVHRLMLRLSIALTYRLVPHRVAVSGGVADDVAELGWLARKAMKVIYNPVPGSGQASHNPGHELWPQPEGPRILNVGSFKTQKNHALLLQAFAELQIEPKAQLVILGEGALAADLQKVVDRLGIQDRVAMPGFLTDPSPAFDAADLFVLSSDYEGFGNVIVEALGHGLPVVSTDCPSGPAEILQGGRFGRLVPVGNAGALARAIEAALADPHDPQALKTRAADFAPERIAEQYLALVQQGGTNDEKAPR